MNLKTAFKNFFYIFFPNIIMVVRTHGELEKYELLSAQLVQLYQKLDAYHILIEKILCSIDFQKCHAT